MAANFYVQLTLGQTSLSRPRDLDREKGHHGSARAETHRDPLSALVIVQTQAIFTQPGKWREEDETTAAQLSDVLGDWLEFFDGGMYMVTLFHSRNENLIDFSKVYFKGLDFYFIV